MDIHSFDPQALVDDLNKFCKAGLAVRLTAVPDENWLIGVEGAVFDQNGHQVGTVMRKLVFRDGAWEARHTGLYLDEQVQGRGFGRAFERYTVDVYKHHGIRQVSLWAQEIGSYAWHDLGYLLAGKPERRREQSINIWRKYGGSERARAAVVAGHVAQDRADEIESLFQDVERERRKPLEPHEIARLADDATWHEAGREMWLGRAILTGAQWVGVKNL